MGFSLSVWWASRAINSQLRMNTMSANAKRTRLNVKAFAESIIPFPICTTNKLLIHTLYSLFVFINWFCHMSASLLFQREKQNETKKWQNCMSDCRNRFAVDANRNHAIRSYLCSSRIHVGGKVVAVHSIFEPVVSMAISVHASAIEQIDAQCFSPSRSSFTFASFREKILSRTPKSCVSSKESQFVDFPD